MASTPAGTDAATVPAGIGAATPASTISTSAKPPSGPAQPPAATVNAAGIQWSGEVPAQKWMNFYTKILSRFAANPGLKLTINIDVSPPNGLSKQAIEETQSALKELGLDDHLFSK